MRRGFTPASTAQREKVRASLRCRFCRWQIATDPAHITDRALGGCDHPDCVIEACRQCHALYDKGELDALPLLTHVEQAHAVGHSGVLTMLHQVTGVRWGPIEQATRLFEPEDPPPHPSMGPYDEAA